MRVFCEVVLGLLAVICGLQWAFGGATSPAGRLYLVVAAGAIVALLIIKITWRKA